MTLYVNETFVTVRNPKTGETKSVPVNMTSVKCDKNTAPTVVHAGRYPGKIVRRKK